ncbi:MAG: hypothetical protein AAB036_11480 [Elusimicrobiota bacterium]
MNLLLILSQPKFVVAGALLLAAIGVYGHWGDHLRAKWERWRYPPAASVSRLSSELVADSRARQSAKLRALHRSVSAEIQAAAENGLDVSHLQILADAALQLDSNESRSAAIENLNKLRLSIPSNHSGRRPAGRVR